MSLRMLRLLNVAISTSLSLQGNANWCQFLRTARFGFLQGSCGCFLGLTVVENLPFWRYFRFQYVFAWCSFRGIFLVYLVLALIFNCNSSNSIVFGVCRSWLVSWSQQMEVCMWRVLRVLFFKIQTIRFVSLEQVESFLVDICFIYSGRGCDLLCWKVLLFIFYFIFFCI